MKMKINFKIVAAVLLIIAVSLSYLALQTSFLHFGEKNEEQKDSLMSFEEYEKTKEDPIIIRASESLYSLEELVNESDLVVKGKLKKVKGVALTQGESHCIVYELKITDTIINNNGSKNDTINFFVPDIKYEGIDFEKIKLDKETVFYLQKYDKTFPHLKEDYYGLISFSQGIRQVNGETEYKELKQELKQKLRDIKRKEKDI